MNKGNVILAGLLCFQDLREIQDSQTKHPEKKSIIKLYSTRRWVPPGPQVSSSLMTERGHIALP